MVFPWAARHGELSDSIEGEKKTSLHLEAEKEEG